VTEQAPTWFDDKPMGPAIKWLVAVNCVVFFAMLISAFVSNAIDNSDKSWVMLLISIPSRTLEAWGANTATHTILLHQYGRLLASAFLHINLLHLAANMYILWDYNRLVEKMYGSSKYMVIYLASALGASIISLMFINPENVSVGASGAIFGSFGAMAAFFWVHRSSFPAKFILLHKKILFVFFVYSVACAYVFKDMDNAAHAGGFLIGLWTGLCIMPTAPNAVAFRRADYINLILIAVVLLIGIFIDNRQICGNPIALGEAARTRASELFDKKRYAESLVELDSAISFEPKKAELYLDRASAKSKLEKYEASLQDCNTAVQLDPNYKQAIAQRASDYHNLQDYKSAVADYSRLLTLDSRGPLVYNNRAWSYDALGDYAKAIEDCNTALRINDRFDPGYDTRGVAFVLSGDMRSALKDFEKSIELKPTEGAAYYHRAYVFGKQGKAEEAAADLKKSRALSYKPEQWEKRIFSQSSPRKGVSTVPARLILRFNICSQKGIDSGLISTSLLLEPLKDISI
jgi:membrane associated rhomboid family serine protease/Flp pilus assembly protein TadD